MSDTPEPRQPPAPRFMIGDHVEVHPGCKSHPHLQGAVGRVDYATYTYCRVGPRWEYTLVMTPFIEPGGSRPAIVETALLPGTAPSEQDTALIRHLREVLTKGDPPEPPEPVLLVTIVAAFKEWINR